MNNLPGSVLDSLSEEALLVDSSSIIHPYLATIKHTFEWVLLLIVTKTTIVQKAASQLPDLEWRRKGCDTYVSLTTDYKQNMDTHFLSLWISNDSHLNIQECNQLLSVLGVA
jgi:hypothetical protein